MVLIAELGKICHSCKCLAVKQVFKTTLADMGLFGGLSEFQSLMISIIPMDYVLVVLE